MLWQTPLSTILKFFALRYILLREVLKMWIIWSHNSVWFLSSISNLDTHKLSKYQALIGTSGTAKKRGCWFIYDEEVDDDDELFLWYGWPTKGF